MPGRNLVAAHDAFIEPIKASLSVLGTLHLQHSPKVRSDAAAEHSWTINKGEGISLGQLRFKAQMTFRYRRDETLPDTPWRVRTTAYMYTIEKKNGREVLAWHWQPAAPGPKEPHLHVGAGVLAPGEILSSKDHVPTGRVAVEEVVRMLIRELDVKPGNESWAEQLAGTEQKFRAFSSWGTLSPPT